VRDQISQFSSSSLKLKKRIIEAKEFLRIPEKQKEEVAELKKQLESNVLRRDDLRLQINKLQSMSMDNSETINARKDTVQKLLNERDKLQ